MALNNDPATQPRSVSMAELWSDSTHVPDLSRNNGDESEHGQENTIHIQITSSQVNETADLFPTEVVAHNGGEPSNNIALVYVNGRFVGAPDGGTHVTLAVPNQSREDE